MEEREPSGEPTVCPGWSMGYWGVGSLAKFIDRKPIKIAALKPTPWRRSKMEITWVGTTKIETSKSGGRMAETPVG